MINRKLHFARLCVLALMAPLAACAPQVKQDDGATVEKRAMERWNLLIAHKAEKAYDYLTPGFRETVTRDVYAKQKNDTAVGWKAAHVTGHTCDADSCTVTVTVDVSVKMIGIEKPQSSSVPTEEHWVKAGREWFYLPDSRMPVIPTKPAQTGSSQPGKS